MLTLPAGDRMIGVRSIVVRQPLSSTLVIGIPRELGHEQLTVRAQMSVDRSEHVGEVCVVQRHRGGDRVEFAEPGRVLDRGSDQTRVSGRARIHADGVKAKLGQSVDKAAIATAEIKDPRTAGEHRSDNRVEVFHHRSSAIRKDPTAQPTLIAGMDAVTQSASDLHQPVAPRRHCVSLYLPCVQTYQHPGWSALGDRTRRTIFERLADRPCAVGELARGLPVSRPAVSQHLKVLKDAGLVVDQAAGTRRIYRLNPDGLAELRSDLDRFWLGALTAYKAVVEEPEQEVS